MPIKKNDSDINEIKGRSVSSLITPSIDPATMQKTEKIMIVLIFINSIS